LQHKSINYQSKKNMKAISTNNAPAAIGPYSQAIEVNGFVYASGQLPIDPATGVFPEGGIKEQTAQSIKNAQMILEAAGTDLKHVVKTTVYLANMSDFAAMNEVYSQFFSEPFPARSAVAVKDLPKGAMVEVEVVATK
jgi:2-iminobutanoate/2-iminopropanoate deaminase